jgi:hypothetical protein
MRTSRQTLTGVVAAVAGTLAFAGAAQAANLTAKYNGPFASASTPAGSLNGVSLPGGAGGLFNFTATAVPAGVALVQDSSAGDNFLAICLEPVEFIGSGAGPYTWTYNSTQNAPIDSKGNPNVPMSNDSRYLDLARLLNGAFPIWDSVLGKIDGAAISSTTALALQLAVWEVANEDKGTNGYSLATGDFKINSIPAGSAAALAQTFLGYIGGLWNNADNGSYRALTRDDQQDFVIKVTSDGDTVVPIPAAAWLLGSGLLGLFGLARRRQKSAEG